MDRTEAPVQAKAAGNSYSPILQSPRRSSTLPVSAVAVSGQVGGELGGRGQKRYRCRAVCAVRSASSTMRRAKGVFRIRDAAVTALRPQVPPMLSYYFEKSSHGGKNFGMRNADSAFRNGSRAKPALRLLLRRLQPVLECVDELHHRQHFDARIGAKSLGALIHDDPSLDTGKRGDRAQAFGH